MKVDYEKIKEILGNRGDIEKINGGIKITNGFLNDLKPAAKEIMNYLKSIDKIAFHNQSSQGFFIEWEADYCAHCGYEGYDFLQVQIGDNNYIDVCPKCFNDEQYAHLFEKEDEDDE